MAKGDGKLSRHLRAVLHADMKDYGGIMGEDEARAIASIEDIRAAFQEAVPLRGGVFEVSGGDSFLAIFESAVEAVEAAIDIQHELMAPSAGRALPITIRIGMHLGEVVRSDYGFMGDSINIAARIQAIAAPGGISLSDDLFRAVRSRLRTVTFRDMGFQELPKIGEPMRVHAVVLSPSPHGAAAPVAGAAPPDSPVAGEGERRTGVLRRGLLAAGLVAVAGGWAARDRLAAWIGIDQAPQPVVLGVMTVRSRGDVPDWMNDVTRDGLNTVLSKSPALQVYSRQKIDFLCEKRGLKEIEAAEQLGITKMIAATLSAVGEGLDLDVQVIDIRTGFIDSSYEMRGSEKQLIEMQNDAAIAVMKALKIPVDEVEVRKLLARRTNDRLEDYKLLTESMGGVVAEEPARKDPRSQIPWRSLLGSVGPRAALAATGAEQEIRTLLDRYRSALEAEDLAQVEALHAALPDPMRQALTRYFQNATRLKVQFSKVDILVEGDEALATFTRTDDFLDGETGLPVHLEVRVSNTVEKRDGAWKLRGLRKPS